MANSSRLSASGSPFIRDNTLPYDVQKTQVGFGMVCIHFSPLSSSYLNEILEKNWWKFTSILGNPAILAQFLSPIPPKKFSQRVGRGYRKKRFEEAFFLKKFYKTEKL